MLGSNYVYKTSTAPGKLNEIPQLDGSFILMGSILFLIKPNHCLALWGCYVQLGSS